MYIHRQIIGTMTEVEITNKSMEQISDEVESINNEIEKLKGEIATYIRNVKEVLPKQRQQLVSLRHILLIKTITS